MSAVTLTSGLPPADGPITVADLEQAPDDGRRYELIDGMLLVSPAPVIAHQVVLHKLAFLLEVACPAELALVPGPGLQMSDITELVPDLVVVHQTELEGKRLTAPPLLAVEIRSPSTALYDMNTKKAVYERFGISSYWVVVPDRASPVLVAFELRHGRYEQVAHVKDDDAFEAERPFSVSVRPAELVAKLP
jgi:Uma2 family endonuclease